jgi:hypothetical protein
MSENIFKYYGLYGVKKDGSYKHRTSRAKDDPYYYERETQYIHDVYPYIEEHMKMHYGDLTDIQRTTEYQSEMNRSEFVPYPKIKTFQFVPHNNIDQNDINNVNELIKISYLKELVDNDRMPFVGLHIMREMNFRGYDKNISKEIIDTYIEGSKDVLIELKKSLIQDIKKLIKATNVQDINTLNQRIDLLDHRIYELNRGVERTCNRVHELRGVEKELKKDEIPPVLLLEDLLNNNKQRQLLLGSRIITKQYAFKDNILISPWYLRSLKMGVYTWNLSINKAMINCFMSNTLNQLFPIRLLFEFHPGHLSFDSITMKDYHRDPEKFKYLGFFIIRYNKNKYDIKEKGECKGLYYHKQDNLPTFKNIQDQYIILFVFKDNIDENLPYKIVNFRINFVEWGNFAEWKRTFLPEIIQVMCFNLEKQISFYSLLKKDNNPKKDLKEICNSQLNDINNGKKTIMKCFESYFFPETLKKINDLGCHPRSENNNLQVLTTGLKIEEIQQKLEENKNYTITLIENGINIKHNESNEEYILLQCHFKWDDTNTKRFGINYGELDLDDKTKEFYQNTLCISDKCILKRDYAKYNIYNYLFNYKENDNKEIFKLPKKEFNREYLLSFFPHLKEYLPKNQYNYININDIDKKKVFNVLYKYLNKLFEFYERNNIQKNKNLFYEIIYTIQSIIDLITTQNIDLITPLITHLITTLNDLENQISINRQNIYNNLTPELSKEHTRYLNIIKKCKEIFEILIKLARNPNLSIEIEISNLLNEEDKINMSGGSKIVNHETFIKLVNNFCILNHNFKIILNNYTKTNINKYFNKLLFYIDSNNVYNKKIFNNNTKYYNKIIPNIPDFINTLYFLVLPEILIISRNLNFVDIILALINNIKITLILYDFNNDDLIKKLKKFNNIKIYIMDEDNKNININFYEKINKIIKNKKYTSIIVDCGRNTNNYYQEKFICIGILLCKKNLMINGTYINYCLIPTKNNNYLNLFNMLYSNFSLNYIYSTANFRQIDNIERFIVCVYTNNNNNNKYDKIAKKYLMTNEIDIIDKIDISDKLYKLLCIKWKEIIFNYKQFITKIFKVNYQKNIK